MWRDYISKQQKQAQSQLSKAQKTLPVQGWRVCVKGGRVTLSCWKKGGRSENLRGGDWGNQYSDTHGLCYKNIDEVLILNHQEQASLLWRTELARLVEYDDIPVKGPGDRQTWYLCSREIYVIGCKLKAHLVSFAEPMLEGVIVKTQNSIFKNKLNTKGERIPVFKGQVGQVTSKDLSLCLIVLFICL